MYLSKNTAIPCFLLMKDGGQATQKKIKVQPVAKGKIRWTPALVDFFQLRFEASKMLRIN